MKFVPALMMAVTLCGSAPLVAQNLANPPVMELTLEPGKVPLKTWKEQPVALIYIQAALAALPNPESLNGSDDLADIAASAMDACEAGNYEGALAKAKRLRTLCERLLDDPKSSDQLNAYLGLTVSLEVFRQCRDYALSLETLLLLENAEQYLENINPEVQASYQLLLARTVFALNLRDEAIKLVTEVTEKSREENLNRSAKALLAWMLASRGHILKALPLRQQLLRDLASDPDAKWTIEFPLTFASAEGLIRQRMGDIDGARKVVSKATRLYATLPSLFANDQLIELEMLELDLAQATDSKDKTLVSQPEFLAEIEQVSRRTTKSHPDPMLDFRLNVLRVIYYKEVRDREKLQVLQVAIDDGLTSSHKWETHTFLKITDDLIRTVNNNAKVIRELDGIMPIAPTIDLYQVSAFENYRAQLHVHLKEFERAERCYAESHKVSLASTGPFSYRSIMAAAFWTNFRKTAEQDTWGDIYLEHVSQMEQAKNSGLDSAIFVACATQRMLKEDRQLSPVVQVTAWSLIQQAWEHSITESSAVIECRERAKMRLAELAKESLLAE